MNNTVDTTFSVFETKEQYDIFCRISELRSLLNKYYEDITVYERINRIQNYNIDSVRNELKKLYPDATLSDLLLSVSFNIIKYDIQASMWTKELKELEDRFNGMVGD